MSEKKEVVEQSMFEKVTFFGKVDRKADGNIASEYPSWSMDSHIEELRESVASKKRAIELGLIASSEVMAARARAEKEAEKLAEIEASRPKLSTAAENRVYEEYKQLRDRISESLFTREDMAKGLADPAKEAGRMVKPCIEINPDVAKMCGISVGPNNRVSRNDAAKVFKIVGKYLGEETNIETLRRDTKKR